MNAPESSDLAKVISDISEEVGRLNDIISINQLHNSYGYYIDTCLYKEVVDLFSEDCEVHFMNGVYKGKRGAHRLFAEWFGSLWGSRDGPVRGLLIDHFMMQGIVTVSPDRQTAKGRFRALCFSGKHVDVHGGLPPGGKTHKPLRIEDTPQQWTEGGLYENLYVKEDGVWKIQRLSYNLMWQGNYDEGWARDTPHLLRLEQLYPEDPTGPDELKDDVHPLWPETKVLPFHYAHPVTGEPWTRP